MKEEKNKDKRKITIIALLFIVLVTFWVSSQYLVIKPPFILIRSDKHEKVNIKSVKLNELQNVTHSIEPHFNFSYARFDDRQGDYSSTNVADVNLTIDIDKQTLYEKVLSNNKIEYIEIPTSLAGYKMIYVKGYSNYHIWVYFVKDNKVKIMLLENSISNRGRFKEIGSITAFGNIYKTFTNNTNRTNDRLVYIEKNKANKIVFYSKKNRTEDIVFYTNKLKNNGIIIERGK